MVDEKDGKGLDRRQFLHLVGGTAGGIALGTLSGGQPEAHDAADKIPLRGGGNFTKRPNFLILMCDQNRFPPFYETDEIRRWRHQYLVTQELLRDNGLEFTRHYTAATACSPARGTIYTGQYPSLHGVSQTDGVAKGAFDADMFWLDPNSVPTMGDYFALLVTGRTIKASGISPKQTFSFPALKMRF